MEDKTAALIEKLADKLGTTAEHLWGVLLHQAPISAAIGLTIDAIIIYALYRMWQWSKTIQFDKWDNDFGKGAFYTGLLIVTIVGCIFAFGSISVELSGFFNPEYWALHQILGKV